MDYDFHNEDNNALIILTDDTSKTWNEYVLFLKMRNGVLWNDNLDYDQIEGSVFVILMAHLAPINRKFPIAVDNEHKMGVFAASIGIVVNGDSLATASHHAIAKAERTFTKTFNVNYYYIIPQSYPN